MKYNQYETSVLTLSAKCFQHDIQFSKTGARGGDPAANLNNRIVIIRLKMRIELKLLTSNSPAVVDGHNRGHDVERVC